MSRIGGAATAVDVCPEMGAVALAAAAAVGADYAGVDLLPARDGSLFVLEVNGIPGWQGLQQATGVDVAAAIVEHVERCVQRGPLRTSRGAAAGMSGVSRDLAAALLAVDREHPPVNVGLAAQLACLLEVSAPKPGNVSPGRHFADVRYEDFLASALAIGEPMAAAGQREPRRDRAAAVEATARWSRSNTNLGIVLLFAPLARAAALLRSDRSSRDGLKGLDPSGCGRATCSSRATVDDARDAYAAIRLAQPGGLGRADAQDVSTEPTVTLARGHAARRASRHGCIRVRDGIRDHVRDGRAGARTGASRRLPWDDAVVETFLTRARGGARYAHRAAERRRRSQPRSRQWRGGSWLQAGVRSDAGRQAIDDDGPGTSGRPEQRQPGNHCRPDGGCDLRRVARRAAGTDMVKRADESEAAKVRYAWPLT